MKNIVWFILCLSAQLIVGQNNILPLVDNSQEDNFIYVSEGLQTKPEFPGGIQKFYDFFNANYKVSGVVKAGVKAQVIVIFIIEKDGSLSDIKVLRDIGGGSGEETLRVIKLTPNWIPGKQNNKLVRVHYALPIKINSLATTKPVKN